jgi:tight adherence protein B
LNPQMLGIMVFITFFLFALGINELYRFDNKTVSRRIKKLGLEDVPGKAQGSKPQHKDTIRKLLAWAGSLSLTRRLRQRIDKKLEEADVMLKGGEFIVIVMVSSLGAFFFIFSITLNFIQSIMASAIAAMIPFSLLNTARAKRLSGINSQLGDALTILANSMRSGYSFIQSMDLVRKELPDPISKEFGRTLREINLGTATEVAMQNMARRVNSEDLDLIITAVLIQRQVGGNLAEVLDNIAEAIRDRIRIKREVKTLTAQGRISGLIIGLLPIFLGIFMFVSNPSYIMELFTNPIGLFMLACAITGEITGIFIIKKIVDINY